MSRLLHAGLDRLAMWLEDRVRHEAEPYRPCAPGALDVAGPLPPVPAAPVSAGAWSAPSPRPMFAGDRMAMQVFPADAPFRGTAVLVPPWKIRSASLVRRYTRTLVESGHDVWLVVPPEHMTRAGRGARSGHGFASLDLGRFCALFEQLVLEVRVALAMARARGPAGLVGLSMGALASAFALGTGEPPGFAALVAPPADLPAVLSGTPIGARYARLASRAGTRWPPADDLASLLARFDPRRSDRPATRVLLAVGRHDRIALPGGALALAGAWGIVPRVYGRGHLTLLFCCRALLRDLRGLAGASPATG